MSKRKAKPVTYASAHSFSNGVNSRVQQIDVRLDNKVDKTADFVTVNLKYGAGTFSVNLKIPR